MNRWIKPFTTLLLIAGLLAANVALVGCRKKSKGIDGKLLSNHVYLNGKGYFVLSNHAGFLALQVTPALHPNVWIRAYQSSNGVSWSPKSEEQELFRRGTNITFGGKPVEISSEGEGKTRATTYFDDEETGIAASPDVEVSLLSAASLKFKKIDNQAVERAIEKTLTEALK